MIMGVNHARHHNSFNRELYIVNMSLFKTRLSGSYIFKNNKLLMYPLEYTIRFRNRAVKANSIENL